MDLQHLKKRGEEDLIQSHICAFHRQSVQIKIKINTKKTNSNIKLCRREKKKTSLTEVCVFFLGVRDMKTFGSPRASTCGDICLKLSLLSSPAVPHFICLSALGFHTDDEGPRCSAMRCSSNPPFFDTWQIINGGLAALRRSSE